MVTFDVEEEEDTIEITPIVDSNTDDMEIDHANDFFELNEDEPDNGDVDAVSCMLGEILIDDFFDDFSTQSEWDGADYCCRSSIDDVAEEEVNENEEGKASMPIPMQQSKSLC